MWKGFVRFHGFTCNNNFNSWLLRSWDVNFLGNEKNTREATKKAHPQKTPKKTTEKFEVPHFSNLKKGQRLNIDQHTLDMTISTNWTPKKRHLFWPNWFHLKMRTFLAKLVSPKNAFQPPSTIRHSPNPPPRYPHCGRFVLDRHVARSAWLVDSNQWGCRSDASGLVQWKA